MSTTIDANVLIYASSTADHRSAAAVELVERLAEGPEILTLFWPTVLAYIRLSTHPSLSEQPLTLSEATENMQRLMAPPHVRTLGEGGRFWSTFLPAAAEVRASGNLVPDAHLVGLMREHGVRTIWTHDRDFRKFDGIEVRDPF